jgi:hypothetical protein
VELAADDLVPDVDATPTPAATMRILTARLHRLSTSKSSWAASHLCAGAVLRALQASAVLVHQLQPGQREVRTVGVAGKRTHDLLGLTTPLDGILSAVMGRGRPERVRFDRDRASEAPDRFRVLTPVTTVIAVPVAVPNHDGVWGFVEVVDPGERTGPLHVAATTHAARQLGRMLADSAAPVTTRAAS